MHLSCYCPSTLIVGWRLRCKHCSAVTVLHTQSGQQTPSNHPASGQQADTQQALHMFFQEYSKTCADELANTCVLLICDAIANSILCWDNTTTSLLAQETYNSVREASTVRLQCKFLAKLIQQSDLPLQAVYDAVCANIPDTDMHTIAVEQWLQQ